MPLETWPHTYAVRSMPTYSVGDYQFAAWYDKDGELFIGRIERGVSEWGVDHEEVEVTGTLRTALSLPGEDDDHNYTTIAVDGLGRIHVWANMHVDTIRYIYSDDPHTSDTWQDIANWTNGSSSLPSIGTSCTYPACVRLPDGTLWFSMRDVGIAGNGDSAYWTRGPAATTWSARTQFYEGNSVPGNNPGETWSMYNSIPWVEHSGSANPGRLHMMWTNRWESGETNIRDYCPSYAYSDDGAVWKTIDGTTLTLPIDTLNATAARIPGLGQCYVDTIVRSSNVVFASLDQTAAEHGIVVNDTIECDSTDGSFDGSFTVTAIDPLGASTIAWNQTGVDDVESQGAMIGKVKYINTFGCCTDDDGNPHGVISDHNGTFHHFYWNGSSWTDQALPNPINSVNRRSRCQIIWFRDQAWLLGSGGKNNQDRRAVLWGLAGGEVVYMSGSVFNVGTGFEPTYDRHAFWDRGVIETFVAHGDSPRVAAFGNHAKGLT